MPRNNQTKAGYPAQLAVPLETMAVPLETNLQSSAKFREILGAC